MVHQVGWRVLEAWRYMRAAMNPQQATSPDLVYTARLCGARVGIDRC